MEFTKVHSRYGAPMGRATQVEHESDAAEKFKLSRVRLNSGGYDDGGAYWGAPSNLWVAECETDRDGEHLYTRLFLRAPDRDQAKGMLRARFFRNARFYR